MRRDSALDFCPCPGVEMRGSPPLAPPLCACVEKFTLPYLTLPPRLSVETFTLPYLTLPCTGMHSEWEVSIEL